MSKINLILIVTLVLQAGLIAIVNVGSDKPTMVEPTKIFEGFDPEKVTKITVHDAKGDDKKGDKSITIEKKGATWGIPNADDYPADAEKVKTFLENVQKLTARGSVVSRETFYRKLEVADDKYQRKVELTHDGKQLGFFLGSSPSFKKIHVRKTGDKNVYLADGLASYDVYTDGRGWVQPKYVDIPKSDVWAMTIKRGAETIALEKGAGDAWAVLGSAKAAKKTDIDSLVGKAATVNLQTPIGKEVKAEYGLGDIQVTLVTGTSTIAGMPPKTTKNRTLLIGKSTKIGDVDQYYVKSDSSDYVVTAPKWAIMDLIEKKVSDLVEE